MSMSTAAASAATTSAAAAAAVAAPARTVALRSGAATIDRKEGTKLKIGEGEYGAKWTWATATPVAVPFYIPFALQRRAPITDPEHPASRECRAAMDAQPDKRLHPLIQSNFERFCLYRMEARAMSARVLCTFPATANTPYAYGVRWDKAEFPNLAIQRGPTTETWYGVIALRVQPITGNARFAQWHFMSMGAGGDWYRVPSPFVVVEKSRGLKESDTISDQEELTLLEWGYAILTGTQTAAWTQPLQPLSLQTACQICLQDGPVAFRWACCGYAGACASCITRLRVTTRDHNQHSFRCPQCRSSCAHAPVLIQALPLTD